MTPEALAAGLRACLGENLPEPVLRAELAASLRQALHGAAELEPMAVELSQALERASSRRDLALAAAKAMRVLSAAEHARSAPSAGQTDGGDAVASASSSTSSVRERRKQRERSKLEHRQTASLREAAQAAQALRVDQQPVERIPGIGQATGLQLRARGLNTLGELAWLLPLGYHDEREITPIARLQRGVRQVTEGRVVSASGGGPRGRGRRMAEVLIEDDGGGTGLGSSVGTRRARLRLVWFRAPPGLLARFHEGARFRVAGLVEQFGGAPSMTHPQTERLSGSEKAAARGVVPRYALVPGVAPRVLARAVAHAVERCARALPDAIPERLRTRDGIGRIGEALAALHAPPAGLAVSELEPWTNGTTLHHGRLALEEFFLLELALHRRRAEEQGVLAEPLQAGAQAQERARSALGFALTSAQERVVAEITADLAQQKPMRRLVQGDVGCGKTAVALLAAAQAIAAGAQVAFMAPTEVLAEQHFRVLAPVAQAMGLSVALTLGGERASHRRSTRKALEEGRVDLVVGTHALLSEGVRFARLRLVIVDEQHRFGVGQRLRLADKSAGVAAHLLVMTATPIPRSLALALHGDLSASVIDELPPGRVPPVTRAYPVTERDEAYRQLERGLLAGGQAYVVCPSIEPNEETGLRSALETFEELQTRFASHGVALLHGALGAEARAGALERFASGQARVLVSTTIVEVGLDVRTANVMLIENAERFGLAQLHQLRGRVGRAGQRSACLLVHEASSEESQARIAVLCESHDGFRIAEEDLTLRGPGELFGRKQSGLPGFRFGDLRRDLPLLQRAQGLARELIELDPELRLEEHAGARAALAMLAEGDRAVVKEEAG